MEIPKPSVLLVEDEPDLARLARWALEAGGLSVRVAETAHRAVELLQALRPDLALLDMNLPDGNGIDLCRRIRAAMGPELPVIFLTAQDDGASRAAAFSAGADDYIVKPYACGRFVARVRARLGLAA